MADEIRAPADFLTALRALADAGHADAVWQALRAEAQRRAALTDSPPQPWTLDAVVSVLADRADDPALFGVIRLLQGAQPSKLPLGYSRRAEDEALRIEQTLLLGFAPAEVDKVEHRDGSRPRLWQSALGLLGPKGALPMRWTEHAHALAHTEYRSQRDTSFHAWINVVQRRQIGLLYRAWSDAQAVTGADRPGDAHPFADRLRALAGVMMRGLRDRDAIPDGFKMAFAAALSRRVRSPGPLAAMLAVFFEMPVRVEEFASHWLEIPVDQRSRLGQRFASLGGDAIAGTRVWDATTRFRIIVGPMSLEDYRRFLPQGQAYAELRDLVSLYAGAEYEWELVPLLKRQEVPYSWAGNPGLLLGWSSWLGVRYEDVDADDLVLEMTPRLGVSRKQAEPDLVID